MLAGSRLERRMDGGVSGFSTPHSSHITDPHAATFAGNGIVVSTSSIAGSRSVLFEVALQDGSRFREPLHCSHLALGRLLTGFAFGNVVEIGSRDGIATRALRFCGKRVRTVEIDHNFEADMVGDYLAIDIGERADAIWCSHVLEHQRNVGSFLEKIYDDLLPGGVLALTVPSALTPLVIGHCNVFTPMTLLYNLILAGFDCADAQVRTYYEQVSVIVRKTPSGVSRISPASTHFGGDRWVGSAPALLSMFPRSVQATIDVESGIGPGQFDAINWQ